MFIRFIHSPHLEDTYLNLGPDIMALCIREFVINVNTNSSNVTYLQTSGQPMVIDTTDPFNPIINIELVKGKFTLKAFGDEDTTDEINILSGPIDTTVPIQLTSKVGLSPVSVSVVGIYTQKIDQFFRWRDNKAKIKWGNISFLPDNVISIKAYRLDTNTLINEDGPNNIILLDTNTLFRLEVDYSIGGNKSTRVGGNWFFDNNAQVDERWDLKYQIRTLASTSRIIYLTTLKSYSDNLNSIRVNNISNTFRTVYKVSFQLSTDYTNEFISNSLNSIKLTNKSSTSRVINIDKVIA